MPSAFCILLLDSGDGCGAAFLDGTNLVHEPGRFSFTPDDLGLTVDLGYFFFFCSFVAWASMIASCCCT